MVFPVPKPKQFAAQRIEGKSHSERSQKSQSPESCSTHTVARSGSRSWSSAPQTSEQVLQRLENYSEKYKEMSSSHGGDARATSAPAQRRWRSGKETHTPDDAGNTMTAPSVEMDLEHVENTQRKKFVPTPGSVPADITLMEEEELSLEKARVKEQAEAATRSWRG